MSKGMRALPPKSNKDSRKVSDSSLNNSERRIGILGGGQLARMLVEASHNLGLPTKVFCESKNEPAYQATANHYLGSLSSEKDLLKFFENVDEITFESEFISVEKIENILKENPLLAARLTFFPKLEVMRQLQDRKLQKKFLKDHHLPTSEDLESIALDSKSAWIPLVLKKRFGGYDGHGTFIFQSRNALESWLQKQLEISCLTRAEFIYENFIVEKWIPFRRELAFSIARDQSGQTLILPLVETHQIQSRCDWVLGPVQHSKWRGLSTKVRAALESIDYVGLATFELFDTGKNLLINEVAPRVHNSAHHSQESLVLSQFDLHLLCSMEKSLPSECRIRGHFAMLNLLGTSPAHLLKARAKLTGKLHWYGKEQSRPGRKMGHINYVSPSKINIKSLLKERQKYLPHEIEVE
jgi:5-(carboxyamino)imidazole ribonucleotide synthase